MAIQVIAALLCVVSYFIGPEQTLLAFIIYVLWCFILQMGTPLLWAKMADVVDYGQYRSGIRITGMTYSSVVFFIKMGLAIGGAMAGWLLAFYGYQPDQAQSADTQQGILLSFTWLPALAFLIVALVMKFYKLGAQEVEKVRVAIESR